MESFEGKKSITLDIGISLDNIEQLPGILDISSVITIKFDGGKLSVFINFFQNIEKKINNKFDRCLNNHCLEVQ